MENKCKALEKSNRLFRTRLLISENPAARIAPNEGNANSQTVNESFGHKRMLIQANRIQQLELKMQQTPCV